MDIKADVKKSVLLKLIEDTEFNIVKNEEILKFATALGKDEKDIEATKMANVTNVKYLEQLRNSLNEVNN
jgi:uncharacterized protein (DUF1499 family)